MEVVDVVQPGDKLDKIFGIHDLIAVPLPLVLLFYPVMDEEILEIIQQKEMFGSATQLVFISKENLPLLGSNTVSFIKDDEQETIFKAFGVVGNNLKAAFWVKEDGEIMTKIQQLTDMKFLLDDLIPGSRDKIPEIDDETMNEDQEREEVVFPWKSEPIHIVGGILFLILLVVFHGFGYGYI